MFDIFYGAFLKDIFSLETFEVICILLIIRDQEKNAADMNT
jgi:hypothetical protein